MTAPRNRAGKPRRTIWLTFALGAAAFLPFVLVFVQSSGRDNSPLSLSPGDAASLQDGLRMLSPSFTGRTPNGEPYVVTADWALPNSPNPTRISLQGVEGTVTLKDGRIATLLASDGFFFPRIRRLRIDNGVAVTTSDGYRLDTESATINADERNMRTEGEVRVTGPVGSIRADSLEALDAEDRIVKFIGNVRVVVKAEQVKN